MKPKELMEKFLEFEYKYKMFGVKINDVHVWHYIRFYVYHDLLKMCGIADVLPRCHKLPKRNYKTTWKDFIRKNVVCNQFFAHERDILIIPHERKYMDGNYYSKCIYTNLLDEKLSNSHYILDGKSVNDKYEIQKSKNILYCDLESFKKFKKVKVPLKMASKSEINSKIIEPIEQYFDVNISGGYKREWFNTISVRINTREYWVRYYEYMLQKISPKLILVVVSYEFNRMILCEVAKKKKIPVVELQHGRIGDMHIAYNFYKKINLPGFPDYIFTYGRFEKENTRFPISEKRIISVGYPELERNYYLYKKQKKENKEKKIILFISQMQVEIAQYANALASKLDMEKYHIIYKLHPKEYLNWKLNVGHYLNHSNIEVAGGFEHTIYEYISQAEWVIGNYSTVLYEAQMFDVKVVVLKFGLYSNVENLYKHGFALLVDSPEQLVKAIVKDDYQPNKEISLFEMDSLNNMQANIDKIIKQHQKI